MISKSNPAPQSRFPDGFRIMQGEMEYVTYIEHSSLRIWYSEISDAYERHCHSAVEIIMPVRGEVIYTLPDAVYRVQSDEALIIPPGCSHELVMHPGSARYLLLFEPDAIFGLRDMQRVDDMLHMPLYLSQQGALQADARAILADCVKCYQGHQAMWNARCYAYLIQLYALLGQDYLERSEQSRDDHSRLDPEIVDSARLFIDQNFRRNLTLEEVSAFTGFSKFYFSRVFKRQMGVSFSEYLRQRRVSAAEELLIHSRQSIQEIAVNSGFGSIATFNRVFREVRGCTPSRYRSIYADLS